MVDKTHKDHPDLLEARARRSLRMRATPKKVVPVTRDPIDSTEVEEARKRREARLEKLESLRGYSPKSNVDPRYPEEGNATTESVRTNFDYTRYEIEALQAAVQTLAGQINGIDSEYVSKLGDTMLGQLKINPSVQPLDPEDVVTKGYVDSTGGGGGLPDAPIDGKLYGRKDANWISLNADGTGGYAITTSDVALANPSRYTFETQEDANEYFYDEIESIKTTGGGAGGPVKWTELIDKPQEIDALDGTINDSLVSAGSY